MGISFRILHNVDSSIKAPLKTQLYCVSNTWTYPVTSDIPVYLVNPDTMDKICPPERRRGIPREKGKDIERIIDLFLEENPENILDNVDKLIEKIDKYSESVECIGVFIARRGHRFDELGIDVELPAIFICPEKIWESAERIANSIGTGVETVFKALLRSVLIHEQTHAYTWKVSDGKTYDYYKIFHVRVLEEILAQYTAYTNLHRRDKIFFTKLSEEQPIEYNTWKILTTNKDPYSNALSFISTFAWANYLIHNKLPPLHYDIFLLSSVFPPRLLLFFDYDYLHHLSIRYGFHSYFHRVLEPLLFSIRRCSKSPIQIEKFLKLYAIVLLRLSIKP